MRHIFLGQTCVFLFIVLVSVGLAFGQDVDITKKSELETGASFRRLSDMLRYVHRQLIEGNSNLDLVDFQREKLSDLRTKYSAAVAAFAEVENKDPSISLPPLIRAVEQLDRELRAEILVDGQYEVVRTSVFLETLEKSGGDFVAVIFDNYLDELGLTDKQYKEVVGLRKKTDERLLAAKRKYEKEVREILDASKNNFSTLLNDSQKGIMDIGK